jgi:hypothetical protein
LKQKGGCFASFCKIAKNLLTSEKDKRNELTRSEAKRSEAKGRKKNLKEAKKIIFSKDTLNKDHNYLENKEKKRKRNILK